MSEALTAARVYLSLPDADVAECRAALLAMRERLVAEYNQLNDGRFMGSGSPGWTSWMSRSGTRRSSSRGCRAHEGGEAVKADAAEGGVMRDGRLDVLSLGAGVQSTTVLLMSCLGELPKLDAAVFADTQWGRKRSTSTWRG